MMLFRRFVRSSSCACSEEMRSWDPTSAGDFGSDLELFALRLVVMLLVMLINTGDDGSAELREDFELSPIFGRLRLRIGLAGVGSWLFA